MHCFNFATCHQYYFFMFVFWSKITFPAIISTSIIGILTTARLIFTIFNAEMQVLSRERWHLWAYWRGYRSGCLITVLFIILAINYLSLIRVSIHNDHAVRYFRLQIVYACFPLALVVTRHWSYRYLLWTLHKYNWKEINIIIWLFAYALTIHCSMQYSRTVSAP